jgi:hypothetical protein
MKRSILALVVFAVVAANILAQTVVENEFEGTLFFLVTDGAPENPASTLEEASGNLDYVPRGGARAIGLGEAGSVLIGYAALPGAEEYEILQAPLEPARVNPIGPERSSVSTMGTVLAWEAPSGPRPIVLDNRYLDWLRVSALSRFADPYRPREAFRSEIGAQPDSPTRVSIQDSLYWRRGGTNLESLKALLYEEELFFLASSLSEMSDGLSVLLNVYENREDDPSRFVVEIPVGAEGESGYVYLWERGASTPLRIGEFVASSFYLEARIFLDALPEEGPDLADPATSFDISTRFSEEGITEEFRLATIFARAIPRRLIGSPE